MKFRNGAPIARPAFEYVDLGQMATIGRSRAISEVRGWKLTGVPAWWFWLFVHIYRLSGFRNRLSVLVQWAWSYMTFGRGARFIVAKDWRSYPDKGGADPRQSPSRKPLNCSGMPSLALRASRITSCRSSRLLPVTRTCLS